MPHFGLTKIPTASWNRSQTDLIIFAKFVWSDVFGNVVVHTFHWILDNFIQPLIDGIIHVVPFRDLTPFVFSVTYYSTTIHTYGNSYWTHNTINVLASLFGCSSWRGGHWHLCLFWVFLSIFLPMSFLCPGVDHLIELLAQTCLWRSYIKRINWLFASYFCKNILPWGIPLLGLNAY